MVDFGFSLTFPLENSALIRTAQSLTQRFLVQNKAVLGAVQLKKVGLCAVPERAGATKSVIYSIFEF